VYKEVVKVLEKAGVAMITIHPRTVRQGYSGKADWSRIKDVVDLVNIPVCGNGDVRSPEDAKRMLDETGCDYVMIGRGAMGNPFIFKQCIEYLETGSYSMPTDAERIAVWHEYLDEATKHGVKFSRLKGQAMEFSKGFDGARKMRQKISPARTVEELRKIFEDV
jgi:tRNA-dihydrouridine synthase B